ncbi:hypothetical protein [Gottfriedia acidiceleris]|uniref:hypothetical protein n=1 Tax=Gottfriedia acidiceleris TaxID=371036 RepID=UPI000B44B389|nr:hypothetical protein [Gottfriedia acidiceleris]
MKTIKIVSITFICALISFVVFLAVKEVFKYAHQSKPVNVEISKINAQKSLTLLNANVDIINDKNKVGAIGITEGENKGKELVPTALYYEFTIKNTSKRTVGMYNKQGLEVNIIPNDNLISLSKEIIGFNIFNPSEYSNSGVGYGKSFDSVLKPGQVGQYSIHFDLGVSEENSQVPLLVPSAEKLQLLKKDALNATLVVTLEDKEILRFNLKEYK